MDIKTLPEYEMRYFARWIARATEAYFENPDVKRRYEEWLKKENEIAEDKEKCAI